METENSIYILEGTILIVTNSDDNLTALQIILANLPLSVKHVNTIAEAQQRITIKHPFIVLLSSNLNNEDSYAFCQQIKADENTTSIPVIFIHEWANQEAIVAGFRAGGDDYLNKPFHEEEVIKRLKNHIELRQMHYNIEVQNEELKNEIIERIRTEQILHESEFFFEETQKAALIGSYKLNFKTGRWDSSEVLDQIFGIDKTYERTIANWAALVYPTEQDAMYRYITEEVMAKHQLFYKEYRIVNQKTEQIHWLLGVGKLEFAADGSLLTMIGTIQDITERKITENILTESDELSRSLLQTIPFGMDIVDENGVVLFQNNISKKLFGEKNIGSRCWEMHKDNAKQCIDCPLTKGITLGVTELFETDDVLDRKVFQISHTGILYEGKKAMLEIFQDITDRKIMEQELIIAKNKAEESDQLKTAFLHNISHEIRTPLNAIVGFSSLINDPNINLDQRNSFSNIIEQSSTQLLSIITDIINIATLESGQERVYEDNVNLLKVGDLIFQQYKSKAEKLNIELLNQIQIQPECAEILTDKIKLTQVLSNLIGNALKFTDTGHVHYGCTLNNNFYEFYVKDTGIGIPAELQEEIFHRFRQAEITAARRFGGSGLGLSISKAYIEMMGGKLWLKSIQGQGSTFFFTIPYKKGDTQQ